MATTANYAFPYPGSADEPNGPEQIGAIAAQIDTELLRVDTKLTAVTGRATSSLTLTSTKTDIAGTSLTFATVHPNSVAVIRAVWDMSVGTTGDNSSHAIGYVLVDNVEQAAQGLLRTVANVRGTIAQVYRVVLPAAGSHTIKLRGSHAGSATTVANQPHTGWIALIIDGG